ncbi:hypothetical protein [Paenibacillus alginolyticus]|uniref:Uncharacterized protein n=1 Tax=Paenibacillus alginolyticus TaxID=59839 RepID=A0ABT4G7B7_9BACL|nr:hypothetical protein [Paenibacillus alginolyticus]MCY9692050.1 hypothetical protein [Paenibacillus alginolyticus]MEC0144240.1 hypothetical protein [Paenibacillus alginolyticus]
MGLNHRERNMLDAILSDLNNVINDLNKVSTAISSNYRTVGGEKFVTPLAELKEKCKKALGNLNSIN